MATSKTNFRRLLLTFEALADLGAEMTADRDFHETAHAMLGYVTEAMGAKEAALFAFTEKPPLLSSIVSQGFSLFPTPACIPMLPKHLHAVMQLSTPVALSSDNAEQYLGGNGNISPEMFRCIAPLKVGAKLVGMLALGHREGEAAYESDDLVAFGLLCNYIALAVHNHVLSQTLEQRVAENLRLLASVHTFYDNALETFANAIDVKHINIRGHSLRVGRFSAGIGEAMGMDPAEVAGLRAAGYLHDIGKVAVDKHIFGKPAALDEDEFREMADHTVVGHQIVAGVQFPWPTIPEIVRSHHERCDGSGYPDHLHQDDMPMAVRIVAVSDTFDAMTSPRPYRQPLSVGETLSEIVRLTPQKFDPIAVHGLLVQVRRDAVGSNKTRFLDERIICNIAPTDVDHLSSNLRHRLTQGRTYFS